jgi:hypothetical protein
MDALKAIETTILAAKEEIEELNSQILEACNNKETCISIKNISRGAELYYIYNGFDMVNPYYIRWNFGLLKQQYDERQKRIEAGMEEPKSGGCGFLAGVILGGILF